MMRRGIGRVGRPSLVGTVARTAVIAGTATAVSNKVSASQANKQQQAADAAAYNAQQQQAAQYAAQQQAAPPPPPPPAPAPAGGLTDEVIGQLKQLGELRDAGILTEEEFAAKKTELLGL